MATEISVDGGETFLVLDFDSVMSDEAEALEDTGMTWGEMADGLLKGSAKAMRRLAWLLERRENPELELADVNFKMSNWSIREKGDDAGPLSEASESSSDSTESSPLSSTTFTLPSGTD